MLVMTVVGSKRSKVIRKLSEITGTEMEKYKKMKLSCESLLSMHKRNSFLYQGLRRLSQARR